MVSDDAADLLEANSVVVPQKLARPASSAMAKWVVSYKLRWDQNRIDTIDAEIFRQLGRQAVSTGDLAQLQAAMTS